MEKLWIYFAIPFLGCLSLSWPICAILHGFRILDQPNQRSSHLVPTPRGGGIAILAVITGSCLWIGRVYCENLIWVAPVVAVIVGVISLIDDICGLSAGIRFATHIAGATVLIWGLGFTRQVGLFEQFTLQLQLPFPMIQVLMVFWIVGYTNAFNFMDGINGIAAVQAGVSAFAMAVMPFVCTGRLGGAPVLLSLVVSGAALGFLPHNFPKARMFMGDVGSAPLGMLLGFLVLWICRDHGFHLLIPLTMIHANFILDTLVTLLRRVFRGDRWLDPHREHFYQRLVRCGFSHTAVTIWEGGLLCVASMTALLVARSSTETQICSLIVVVMNWVVFFGVAEYLYSGFNQKKQV